MRRVTYGYHDKRGGRESRINRAVRDGQSRFPDAVTVEASLRLDEDDKAPVRVEVTLPAVELVTRFTGPECDGEGCDEFQHYADCSLFRDEISITLRRS